VNMEIWDDLAKINRYDSIKHLLTERYLTNGHSVENIALDLNVHRKTVMRLIIKLDLKRPEKETVVLTEHEATNLTLGQIARRYGISKSTAWRIRRKLLGS